MKHKNAMNYRGRGRCGKSRSGTGRSGYPYRWPRCVSCGKMSVTSYYGKYYCAYCYGILLKLQKARQETEEAEEKEE